MYKRVSIALKNPIVAIFLRLATLVLLSCLAWFRLEGIELSPFWLDTKLFIPLAIVSALSFANLLTESAKYRCLIGSENFAMKDSFRSVIAGMSVGIWTPNRVGEFMGRMRYAPSQKKKKSVSATLTGSVLQGGLTILFGILGLSLFDFQFQIGFDLAFILLFVSLFFVVLFYVFYQSPFPVFQQKYVKVNQTQLWAAFGLAFLRYLIFSSQFVLLLFAFGFTGSVMDAFGGVFILYAIQSYIPGSLLSELGVREVLSVLIFSPYFDNTFGAPLAAFCLWALNIGLPIVTWSLYSGYRKIEA